MTLETALVAGGAGFIGSHLCERLLRDDWRVICVDNLSTGRQANIKALSIQPAFTYIEHDIIHSLPPLPRIDQIFHLASSASPPAYQRWPIETLRVNSEGTRRLLELATRDHARFLYFSTSEVYGDPLEHPQVESYRGNVSSIGPRSMYDEAKRYGEALTMAYSRVHEVDTSIVRVFNTYGPRMDVDDGRAVSNFVGQALRGEPLTVYGDGNQTRSFQYIEDLIEGVMRLPGTTYGEPVNLGNPDEYSMLDLATLVREITGSQSPITFRPLPQDDPKQRKPDISLARELLGWSPKVPISEGLRHTIAYFESTTVLTGHESAALASHVDGRGELWAR